MQNLFGCKLFHIFVQIFKSFVINDEWYEKGWIGGEGGIWPNMMINDYRCLSHYNDDHAWWSWYLLIFWHNLLKASFLFAPCFHRNIKGFEENSIAVFYPAPLCTMLLGDGCLDIIWMWMSKNLNEKTMTEMWLNHPVGFVCLKPPSCQRLTLIFTKKSLLRLDKNISLFVKKIKNLLLK